MAPRRYQAGAVVAFMRNAAPLIVARGDLTIVLLRHYSLSLRSHYVKRDSFTRSSKHVVSMNYTTRFLVLISSNYVRLLD